MARFGRKSPAEKKRAINAHLEFLAQSGAPKARELLNLRSKVREYKPRKQSTERRERHILAEILSALENHPKVARVRRRQVGGFMEGGRYILVGRRGDPDIEGMLHGGMAFGIEVKREGEEPDEQQRKRLEEIRSGGGKAGCAHSIEEAIAIIDG